LGITSKGMDVVSNPQQEINKIVLQKPNPIYNIQTVF
jgi:hypothetical protein